MNKLFGYSGGKQKHNYIINSIIMRSNKDIYCEPFLGSGFTFLNLKKEFKVYHIAEKSRVLLNIFKQGIENKDIFQFKDYFYKKNKEYNGINTYDGFYAYRKYYNENVYKLNNLECAFGTIILISNCINSMFRENENGIGFNNSFGNRFLSKYKINNIYNAFNYLQKLKGKVLYYIDYKDIRINDALYFLDPPYFNSNINYSGWFENDTKNMLDFYNLKDNDIIYTDILNKYGDIKFKNKIFLQNIKNISPNRKRELSKKEVLYSNIFINDLEVVSHFIF